MFEFLNITKAMAEENRLRILLALEGRELFVCQIIELLELAPSMVSRLMNELRQARLVNGNKEGRWMYYRLANGGAPAQVQEAIAWVKKIALKRQNIGSDANRMKGILKIDRKALPNRQMRSSAGQNS